jgi:glucose-1-phosphate cytidylyltransferase
MVEIGGKPILWHVMKIYAAHGVTDFVICLGYKGYFIKEYFANYFLHMSNVTFDMSNNSMEIHNNNSEPWKVTLVDTGDQTMTGGRIKRIRPFVGDEDFCCTYGDGVGDVDITALLQLHQRRGTWATLTATQPPGRFGAVEMDGEKVISFQEKPVGDGGWINGGFFVLSAKVFDLIDGDNAVWEREPMQRLAHLGQLSVYRHQGFWQPMDTLRDKQHLEELWQTGRAPWKVWQ